jgi:hypothetical protein
MANTRTNLRRQQALDLRLAGATYRQIGERLGVSPPIAWKHTQAALQQAPHEPAQEVREIELARLDRLHMAHWPQALGGSVEATDRVLKLMDRRVRLLGLDQPASHPTPVGGQPSVLDELRARRAGRVLT